MTQKWKHLKITQKATFFRTGWWGVWDALKAAITRDKRVVAVDDIHFSFWARGEIQIHKTELETAKG